MSVLADERGIIVPFFLKLIVTLAVLGVVTVETTAVIFARVQAQDTAETAANAAAGRYQQTRSVDAARLAAEQAVEQKDPDARLGKPFVVETDGDVRVTVRKRATTLVIHRIPFLEGFAVARGRAVGSPSPL